MSLYILPSHPTLASADPLGITDADEPTIWEVIVAGISWFHDKTLWDLPSLIETLVYSVHGNGKVDTRFLRNYLASEYPNPNDPVPSSVFREILENALALPTLYPDHTFMHLSKHHPIETLTPQQIKCLVAHQLLGTLTPPKGNYWGCTFLSWFPEPQPLENAVHGYLTTLFDFFLVTQSAPTQVTYHYLTTEALKLETGVHPWETCDAALFEHLTIEAVSARNVKFPHETLKCMPIASSKSPGFGASCTQEELVTGACPELLPLGALFVSPPVPDDAVLMAQGIRPATEWRGRGRDARVEGCTHSEDRFTFLLLDALELDHADPSAPLLDLVPKNLLRELQKAYTGFSALRASGITDVASPLWGAGAFGGDPIVKALILGMAGARAGVRVSLSVDEAQAAHDRGMPISSSDSRVVAIDIMKALIGKDVASTVKQVWAQLNTDAARACVNGKEVASLL
ncbi:hypothetical protein DXG01_009519 [Tephrocybe rancida]|nr:hypothetical protein DXG01_009519 [Tephrocybe rancida]